MILMIGDSLAVGTPLAEALPGQHVEIRARVGIGTAAGIRAFLHPVTGARVIVVSLGTNDGNAEQVRAAIPVVKRAARNRCLLWVEVSGVPWARAVNATIRKAHVRMVPWRLQAIHPTAAGYRVRAKRIARYVRGCK